MPPREVGYVLWIEGSEISKLPGRYKIGFVALSKLSKPGPVLILENWREVM